MISLEGLISLTDEVNEIREKNEEGTLIFKEADELYAQMCNAIDVLQDLDYIKSFVGENNG